MVELPEVPNLDMNAPPAPAPVAPQRRATSPVPAESVPGRVVSAPIVKPPPAPVDAAPPSEVQDSVEEVLQHTSAQTLKLSHLEDVLNSLNRTLTDLQEEMHAGFVELRTAIDSGVASAVGARSTEVREKSPLSQNIDNIEEQVMTTARRQTLFVGIAVVQAILLVVVLVVLLTSHPKAPAPEPIEPTTTPAAVAPAPSAPALNDGLDPLGGSDDAKHKDKKKKGRHH